MYGLRFQILFRIFVGVGVHAQFMHIYDETAWTFFGYRYVMHICTGNAMCFKCFHIKNQVFLFTSLITLESVGNSYNLFLKAPDNREVTLKTLEKFGFAEKSWENQVLQKKTLNAKIFLLHKLHKQVMNGSISQFCICLQKVFFYMYCSYVDKVE